eukprot:9968200-Alexandrium_andersonii.AAC.1
MAVMVAAVMKMKATTTAMMFPSMLVMGIATVTTAMAPTVTPTVATAMTMTMMIAMVMTTVMRMLIHIMKMTMK